MKMKFLIKNKKTGLFCKNSVTKAVKGDPGIFLGYGF